MCRTILIVSILLSCSSSDHQPRGPSSKQRSEPGLKSVCPVNGAIHPYIEPSCPTSGSCDDPVIRDTASTQARLIRAQIHVIHRSDGIGRIPEVAIRYWLDALNQEAIEYGFELYSPEILYHSDDVRYCVPPMDPSGSWLDAIRDLRSTYSVSPTTHLNIFFSCGLHGRMGKVRGHSTFPWDPDAQNPRGGIWLANTAVFSRVGIHELGHALGLYHTYRGSDEVSSCGSCYDFASGRDGDHRGDFLADTPAEIYTNSCEPYIDTNYTGATYPHHLAGNPMGGSFDSCFSPLTEQQKSRAHCWFASTLSSWEADDTELCYDGGDNDGDGLVDCADTDCYSASSCDPCSGGLFVGPLSERHPLKTWTYESRYDGRFIASAQPLSCSLEIGLELERYDGQVWIGIESGIEIDIDVRTMGFYRWRVERISGSGEFEICIQEPNSGIPVRSKLMT